MNATSENISTLPQRMGTAAGSPKPQGWSHRGTPRGTVPPIEQRFTRPIRPAVDIDRRNPFGPVPGLARRKREHVKAARALILSPANIMVTLVLVALSAAAYVGDKHGPEVIVKLMYYL